MVAALVLAACGEASSGTLTSVDGPTTTASSDRSPDRDRIHRSVEAMLEACGDRDRMRLRTGMHERMHDEADAAMFRYHDPTHIELLDETTTFDPDGEGATVEARLRIRERDEAMVEAMVRWRFEWDGSAWRSADLPPCLDGGPEPVPPTGAPAAPGSAAPGSTVQGRDGGTTP